MSDVLPYRRGTLILHLLAVRNNINYYFALYTRLTHSRIRMEIASPAYLGLGII